MIRFYALLVVALAMVGAARADEVFERAFYAAHEYMIGARMCAPYAGEGDLIVAETLLRRFWVSEEMSGTRLEAAMTLSRVKADEAIANRGLPSTMRDGDPVAVCAHALAGLSVEAEAAVSAKAAR